jgi:D-sedoheptulose 7-phosphate isomerase
MTDAILRKVSESTRLALAFFEAEADRLDACARALAARFADGARLWAFGNGGSAADAEHVAVEFQHPIVAKRRPLPAFALVSAGPTLTAIGNDTDFGRVFEDQLELFARRGDVALGLSSSGASANVNRGLRRARALGCLTVGFAGRDGGAMVDLCDHPFVVPSWSIHRIQESHTMLLHLLWDQVHVALGADDVL